jgi:hypothetical protein
MTESRGVDIGTGAERARTEGTRGKRDAASDETDTGEIEVGTGDGRGPGTGGGGAQVLAIDGGDERIDGSRTSRYVD